MVEDKIEVIKGIWSYTEHLKYEVKIVKSNTLYGSGDYEDDDDICNDKEIECFYIFFTGLNKERFSRCSEGFLTLQEAIEEVENLTSKLIVWSK